MAVTRARRHLALVCDSQTVQNHGFLKSLIDHMTECGDVRTAFEYLQDIVPQNYTRDHKEGKTNANANSSSSTKPKGRGQPGGKVETGRKMPSMNKSKGGEATSDSHTKVSSSALTEEQQTQNKYATIKEQIEGFLKEPNLPELQFPSSLNSHDRLLVHQISEELGLRHESQGEGKDRCITVSRPPTSGPGSEEELVAEKCAQPEAKEVKKNDPEPKSGSSSQIQLNLKSLHLERMKREQEKREENAQLKKQHDNLHTMQNQTAKKSKSKGKSRTKAGACDIAAAATVEDDFDMLISAVVKAESVCSFVKCKASVLTLGQLCQFCNRQYCLSHHIPEVHGCGDKAKSHARMRISKEGVLYAGSGQKDKSVDPHKKAYLHRKLDSKLKDMATQRKMKPKEKD